MKISICHYSYHRTWEKENWDCARLAVEVKKLGVDAVDYHVRYLGEPERAAERVRAALRSSGLELSGISMSNNFNQDDPVEFKKQVSEVKT
jgi:sugar phosphate isomerase/epimerase